jgi:hypothetical protein
MIIVQ